MASEYQVAKSMQDWRGLTIKPGTHVAYPAMSGRSVEMVQGVVVEIRLHGLEQRRRRDLGRHAKAWETYNHPVYSVVVRPQRSSRDFYRSWQKDVTIQISENITVLP